MKLPKNLQTAIDQAAVISKTVNRGVCTALETKGIEFIQKQGMKVYAPSLKEKEMFKELSQKPVIDFLKEDFKKKNADLKWFDKFFSAVDEAERALGYK
jgi:TRAP-type C4-dicarboxylate transport system substrate-binding protein